MSRRKAPMDGVFEFLAVAPLWAGPVLAAVVFVVGYFVLPSILDRPSETGIRHGIAPIIKIIAEAFTAMVLLGWVIACLKRLTTRRTFNGHASGEGIRDLSWREFEHFVGEAFRLEGYSVEQTGDPAGDGGVDVVLRKDGQMTLVQCKHWKAWKVGVRPVRELAGVMMGKGAQAAVCVTSGVFTQEARRFARESRIRLIDGDALAELVARVRASGEQAAAKTGTVPRRCLPGGLSPVSRESGAGENGYSPPAQGAGNTVPVFSSPPTCPRCGSVMVLRTARRGASSGSQFWGCPAYPRCGGTRPA